jgi:hypothetical protein
MQPADAERIESADEGSSPALVAPVLAVAVVCAGIAYPVTAAALRYTSASVITHTRALAGCLVMLPILALGGAHLPRGWRAWGWACRPPQTPSNGETSTLHLF